MGEDFRIVVLQRGWVFVGKYSKRGEECTLENAHCIRLWGTTKGLGELRDKPLSGTKLDPAGTINYHQLTEVFNLHVNYDGWREVCGK